jgi:hypothetical protein
MTKEGLSHFQKKGNILSKHTPSMFLVQQDLLAIAQAKEDAYPTTLEV